MPSTDELAFLDALDQAKLVRSKEIKPIELVDAAIERIERVNPVLNAVVAEMFDSAREMTSGPLSDGPFSGVPFLMKDFLAEYAGVPFTESSRFLSGYIPDRDTELVTRYKQAGLITVGKTNLPEFAIGATTEPELFGPTRNPWDTERTTGGSSGGAAAAVASGMVPMAHGNDAGGSIRIPAACCGVFGLKPSRARNPLGPYYGEAFSGIVAEHALTRSVRDSAALLDATAGPDLGDPYPAYLQERPYLDEVGADPGKLRIAFATRSPLGVESAPDCVEAVRDVAGLCEELGHVVVEDAPTFDGEVLWQSFTRLIAVGTAAGIAGWAQRLGKKPTADQIEPFIWALIKKGGEITAPEYLNVVQDMHRISREIAPFFADYDLWLTPTLGKPPVPLGTFSFTPGDDPFELRRRLSDFAPYTYLSNATGQPSMSMPLYWNEDDLPIGVHFNGRLGDEATLFRIAAQLESARPWADRRPPVSA